jgi:hypothetical protein
MRDLSHTNIKINTEPIFPTKSSYKNLKVCYSILMTAIVQIEKKWIYFKILFITQKYRDFIIFQDHAHFQSHIILGEWMRLRGVYNLNHDNCIFYCFLQLLLLLIFIQSKCRRINITLDVTEYIDAYFSTEFYLFFFVLFFFLLDIVNTWR